MSRRSTAASNRKADAMLALLVVTARCSTKANWTVISSTLARNARTNSTAWVASAVPTKTAILDYGRRKVRASVSRCCGGTPSRRRSMTLSTVEVRLRFDVSVRANVRRTSTRSMGGVGRDCDPLAGHQCVCQCKFSCDWERFR